MKKVFTQSLPQHEDNKIMPEFHKADWDKKLSVILNLKMKGFNILEKNFLYMEKPEMLNKSDYNLIHKDIAKKLLSTNNEKWNTIPRTYSEIDTLEQNLKKKNNQKN